VEPLKQLVCVGAIVVKAPVAEERSSAAGDCGKECKNCVDTEELCKRDSPDLTLGWLT
jgi:hypothetical protein